MPDSAHSMTSDNAKTFRNVDQFFEELDAHSAAAVPLYFVRTREPIRTAHALQDYANREETNYKLWQVNTGWQHYPDPLPNDQNQAHRTPSGAVSDTADMAKALIHLNKAEDSGIYVMMHPHGKLENSVIQQYLNDIAYRSITRNKQRTVLIVPEDAQVPVEIEHNVHIMTFRPPSHPELRDTYDDIMESIEEEERPNFSDDQIDIFIQNGIGMTAQDFGTAIALAAIAVQPSAKSPGWNEEYESDENVRKYTQHVLDQKIEAVKKTNILSIMPPVDMSNVGGMDLLKTWLEERAQGYTKEARDFGLEIPKGMLAVGPPGSGKSLFAKAVSSVFRVPLVILDVGKIFDKYVGNSEGKMRAMLRQVEDMAPCVLLVDEIDKGFGGLEGGGGDGGTSKRVLGTFLTWLQERDKEARPVFVVMTANNVIGLPPELFRKGRIDEIFAVTFPSDVERAEILKIHLSKRGHELSANDLRKVAEATQNFVGAELEAIVTDGLYAAFKSPEQVITADILIQQRKKTKPLFEIFPDKVRAMLEWAKNNAKAASSGMSFEMPDDPKPTNTGRQLTMRRPTGPRPVPPRPGRSMDS